MLTLANLLYTKLVATYEAGTWNWIC